MKFKLHSKFKPAGGQIDAIKKLVEGAQRLNMQTLLGITGSGKTFTVANVIEKLNKKTLVLAHNKTLAAQLYSELKGFFPENRVEYFISYYDYYQPESYVPTTDTYIEKEATINSEIEKMRLKTLTSLLSREDVIVVASISCIYGAGNPEDFKELSFALKVGEEISQTEILTKLVSMLYERSSQSLEQGQFRIFGENLDIFLPYDDVIIRVELFGDEIEGIKELHCVTQEVVRDLNSVEIFPAKQFAVTEDKQKSAIGKIRKELDETLPNLELVEAERLKRRVNYDIEMMEEVGYCTGIENYSRHFERRDVGTPPKVLLDYFGGDFLLVIDESHQTIPQSHGMYKGDYSRKKNLVDFGFRLPCAYDNRPLKFEEFEKYFKNVIFVSATPGNYELEKSGCVVEQIIRPTGLLDPKVEIKKVTGQIRSAMTEIKKELEKFKECEELGGRVFITTLTKRMAEDICEFLAREKFKVRYLHSDIDSLERVELLKSLRLKEFDILVGINLLREGLDIPEVSLVLILDADKEGFLRNERSLIQTMGRAARNKEGRVICYADVLTKSLISAVEITKRRREIQRKYNLEHGIVPQQIVKRHESKKIIEGKKRRVHKKSLSSYDIEKTIIKLEYQMKEAAEKLEFERAIEIRDEIEELKS